MSLNRFDKSRIHRPKNFATVELTAEYLKETKTNNSLLLKSLKKCICYEMNTVHLYEQ